jgi:hypothetical protein
MTTGLHRAKPYATDSGRGAEHCIQIGRVSAAEYFQGAFGQKAARTAIEPQWLFRPVRIGRGPQVDTLTRSPMGWRAVSFARTAPVSSSTLSSTIADPFSRQASARKVCVSTSKVSRGSQAGRLVSSLASEAIPRNATSSDPSGACCAILLKIVDGMSGFGPALIAALT